MTFFVYDNHTHNRIRVHHAGCHHMTKGTGSGNGDRIGPFDSYDQACSVMEGMPKRDKGDCAHCKPGRFANNC